jgi:hypothetical protein
MEISSVTAGEDLPVVYRLSPELWHPFFQWVKTQAVRPRYYHAQDWFRDNYAIHDMSQDACDQLIGDAVKKAVKEVEARFRVRAFPISPTQHG